MHEDIADSCGVVGALGKGYEVVHEDVNIAFDQG
jgi:hypothetical protein